MAASSDMEIVIDQEPLPPMDMSVDDELPSVEDAPVLNAAGRVARKRRPTWKILERLPAPPTPVPDVQPAISNPILAAPSPIIPDVTWNTVHTTENTFGLYREFPTLPTHNPDDTLTISDLTPSDCS